MKNDFPVIPEKWMIKARLQRFNGTAEPADSIEVPIKIFGQPHTAEFAGATWNISCELRKTPDRVDALDGLISFRIISGMADDVNAGIEFIIGDWNDSNFLMLPGAAYNGNRYKVRYQKYPPVAEELEDISLNPGITITDVPRLEIDVKKSSHLQILTGDETTPCISFFSTESRYACIILTDQGNAYGNHGIHVLEEPGHCKAILRIESPGVRGRLYMMMNTGNKSWDRGTNIGNGGEFAIRFRIFRFQADKVQVLYDRFAEVRKDLTGPVVLQNILPFSEAWKILEEKYCRHNWNPAGYYTVGPRKEWETADKRYSDWQLGWVGGGMSTLPLLFQGTEESRAHAISTLEWLFTKGTSPTGMPYGIFHSGKPYSDNFRKFDSTRWVMLRKLGDALYFVCKHIDLMKKQNSGRELPEHWERGIRNLADGLIRVFEKHGQLGQFLDWDTWEILVGGSTAGAMVPGGLALAGKCLNEKRYLEFAGRIARHFIEKDIRSGVTTGGPGEILQSPDSESAFAMLESLVVLYENTQDVSWLKPAEEMAKQCMTWCVSYDYRFPVESWLGRSGIASTGSVWANVQNKHSAPGICTLSGNSLFKLWRANGNDLYLEQIRETAHNLPQYLSRSDRPLGDPSFMETGFMCERVNLSDWEGVRNVGGSLFGSCWCEVSLMLTTMDIPGIYLQTDTGRLEVFDHVNAELLSSTGGKTRIRITNPTNFNAEVRIIAETSREARTKTLGQNSLYGVTVAKVPVGKSIEVII